VSRPRPCPGALCQLAAAAALVAEAAGAHAEVSERCRELFVESQFEPADACLDEALAEAEGSPSALAEVYAFRAAILAALRLDDEALRVMTLVLALEPSFEPTDPLLTSPKITELLAAARAEFDEPTASPSLVVHRPTSETVEEALVVDAEVANVRDPLEVVLLVRGEGSAAYRPIPFRPVEGGLLRAVLPLEPADRVEYFVAVRTEDGRAALREGSAESPLRAERAGRGSTSDERRSTAAVGIGRRLWWVWALVGVAVVTTTVGLAVGLGTDAGEETGAIRLRFP
jgi:hypothetical protein